MKLNKDRLQTILFPIALAIIITIMWQTEILHRVLNTDVYILPLPTRIFTIISENAATIMWNVGSTVSVAIPGLIFGSLLGYLLAVIATRFKTYGMGGLTIVSAFNAVPIVALAPVIANWTKDVSPDAPVRSMVAKIIVVTIMCTASMSVNAYRGLNELKPFSQDLMKSLACSEKTIFFKLRIPNSIPYIFIALRVSVPASVISTLVAEYFAEYITGVGRQIREGILIAQYATAWSYIVVACLLGIVMYSALLIAEGICLKNRKN